MDATGKVLVVDRDTARGELLRKQLSDAGFGARSVEGTPAAMAVLEDRPFDVVVADLQLAGGGGIELLGRITSRWPGIAVVLVTAEASAEQAIDALKAGATDLLLRPVQKEQLLFVIQKALTAAESRLEEPPAPSESEPPLFGESAAMRAALDTLKLAATGTATVLVRGESGTGKELAARALHSLSPRAGKPLVKIDCASLPENLLESELFGYEKGAFTGAVARKPGRVELADHGTLFLDEIGELTLPLQAKLLRLLQDREIERLGGTATLKVDVRVVAATHRDLETMVERNQFRQDLFYRLNVVPLWLPPLRARRDDVDVLARRFCKGFAEQNGKPRVELDAEALGVLRAQRWPGNVRQLQNFVERLVVLAAGPNIGEADVAAELSKQVRFVTQVGATGPAPRTTRLVPADADPAPGQASVVGPLGEEIKNAEKKALERALRHAAGNRSLAARLLGISRSTFYAKLEEHGLL